MAVKLQSLSRWLLLLAIFYAPWAFGCTGSFFETGLILMIGLIFILWIFSSLTAFQFPKIPFWLFASSFLILIFGWWMALNGHYLHDDRLMKFIPITSFLPSWAGSCEKNLSLMMMRRITMLIFTMWMAADFASDRVWRKRIFAAMALAGCSIALWGLIQRILQAPSIFWMQQYHGNAFFSTFRYHANAGAYMNLILPTVAGWWVLAMSREGRHFQRIFWAACAILMLTAIVVNTSRGAGFVAVLICLGFLFWQKNFFKRFFKRMSGLIFALSIILCVILLIALSASTGFQKAVYRWQELPQQMKTLGERLPAHSAWIHVMSDSGFWGTGAGTFRAVSSYYRHYGGESVNQFWWKQAHQDYLQTIIEWGYFGFLLWAFIFLGAIFCGIFYLKQKIDITGLTNRIFMGCVMLAILGVMIHAAYDFPLQICSIQFYVAILLGIAWSSSMGWTRSSRAC